MHNSLARKPQVLSLVRKKAVRCRLELEARTCSSGASAAMVHNS